ncbi:unnamed protein product [Pedinophyceae sp. YPF-701]|nr:unnamed protein product [Pedinophyceae sp. YPF-701]
MEANEGGSQGGAALPSAPKPSRGPSMLQKMSARSQRGGWESHSREGSSRGIRSGASLRKFTSLRRGMLASGETQEDVEKELKIPAFIRMQHATEQRKNHARRLAPMDKGGVMYQFERAMLGVPALIGAGQQAGKSRVQWVGSLEPDAGGRAKGAWSNFSRLWHLVSRDFFTTVVNMPFHYVTLVTFAVYLLSILLFSAIWHGIAAADPDCFTEFNEGWHSAWAFSIETQITIGYGFRSPTDCVSTYWVMFVQSMVSVVINAVFIGVIFARISHPSYRARSVFVSESVCLARRDGTLCLMFRVADIRPTPVVDARASAFLYVWGPGRRTAEGESVPVQVYELQLPDVNGRMLLPLVVCHEVSEASPLYGHTHESLTSLDAEIVFWLQGTSDIGSTFLVRRSYLAREIQWGCVFKSCIYKPKLTAGDGDADADARGQSGARYKVDLSKFHDVEPQPGLPEAEDMQQVSLFVVREQPSAQAPLPFPEPGEGNALVLSNKAVVMPREDGAAVAVRVADTHTAQIVAATARMYLYRWKELDLADPDAGIVAPADMQALGLEGQREGLSQVERVLPVGFDAGGEQLWLRFPTELRHDTSASGSPLAAWSSPEGLLADAGSELVVVVEGTHLGTGSTVIRRRTYRVPEDVLWGAEFVPMVFRPKPQGILSAPLGSTLGSTRNLPELKRFPRVLWNRFHATRSVMSKLGFRQARASSVLEGGEQEPRGSAPAVGSHGRAGSEVGSVHFTEGSLGGEPLGVSADELRAYWPALDGEGSRAVMVAEAIAGKRSRSFDDLTESGGEG